MRTHWTRQLEAELYPTPRLTTAGELTHVLLSWDYPGALLGEDSPTVETPGEDLPTEEMPWEDLPTVESPNPWTYRAVLSLVP
jgi:hypothetical protein